MRFQRHFGRACRFFGVATIGAALVVGGGQRSLAQDDSVQGQALSSALNTPVTVELDHALLSVALKLIHQRTGINIVVVNAAYKYDRVSLSLQNRPVNEVLSLIAESAGADLWQKDGIYFIGPKGSAPRPEPADPQNLPDIVQSARDRGPRHTEKIKLIYSDPQVVVHELTGKSGMRSDFLDQFSANVFRQILNINEIPFHPAQTNAGPQFAPAYSGPATAPPPQVAPAVNTGGDGLNNLNSQNDSALPRFGSSTDDSAHRDNATRDEFGRGGQVAGRPGGGAQGFGQAGGGAQGGGIQNGQQGSGAGAGLLPQGINPTDIYAFDADNSIIVVSNDAAAIAELKRVISFLDVKPIQIQIKAEFVTVSQNDVSSFGIDWNFQKVNLLAGVSTGFQVTNTAFIQYAAGNVQTQLSFILTTGRGKLVTAPMATTINNVPITFNNVTSIPIFLSTPVISQNGTVALAPSLQIAQAFTGLAILPRVNGDGSISLAGTVQVTDIPSFVTGPNGASAPTIVQQPVTIQRVIRDGDTMVIAGLIRKRDSLSQNKVPLLGDLPLIGSLFRSRNVTTDDSELLVFITPSIIPERAPNTPVGGIGIGSGVGSGGGLGTTLSGPGTSGSGTTP